MNNQIRLGLDLDGVVFDFNTHFVNLARTTYPDLMCPTPNNEWPTEWDYLDRYLARWQVNKLWKHICHQSDDFWYTCPRYTWSEDIINYAHSVADQLYFITSRQGRDVQFQTVSALKDVAPHDEHYGGVIPTPNADAKIPIIKALSLTHYVDDKKETVRNVLEQCPTTNVAVWDQPWNRDWPLPNRLKNVEDLKQWLQGSYYTL